MSIAFLSSRFTQELPRTVHRAATAEWPIEVKENTRYRWLTFGNAVVQSAMSKSRPEQLVLPYTRSMLAPLIFNDAPQRILLLGIGGGSLARYLSAFLPAARVTAVDVSAAVVDAARTYFGLPPLSDRFTLEVADAREVLTQAPPHDLILLDIFDEAGMPQWVASVGLLQAARGALSEHGALVVNLMPDDQHQLAEHLRPIRHVFSGHVLCTTLVDYRNVIAVAFREAPAERELRQLGRQAHRLQKRFRIPLTRIMRNISSVNVCDHGRLVI